jgi:RNA polymerase sigma-70 factor, ECF subfamily
MYPISQSAISCPPAEGPCIVLAEVIAAAMITLHHRFPVRFGLFFSFTQPVPSSSYGDAKSGTAAVNIQFEKFFQQYERQITGYLCRMVGDEQIAHDLSQETFVRAWEHFGQLQESVAARAWLYRVATNLALRHLERHRARPMYELDDTLPGDSDPGRRIVENDRVQDVLMTLTPKQRSVLVLHDVHGLTCDEIAKFLNASRDSIKKTLWRGREQFRITYLREEEQK